MLFMITQTHTPDTCPKSSGGAESLFNKSAVGVELKGRWGAWAHHKIFYLVEAGDADAITRFLDPGMEQCTCLIEPVGEAPIRR